MDGTNVSSSTTLGQQKNDFTRSSKRASSICAMKRCRNLTKNFRPVVQLPGDQRRGVVCLSRAFQVKSSSMFRLYYFGGILE